MVRAADGGAYGGRAARLTPTARRVGREQQQGDAVGLGGDDLGPFEAIGEAVTRWSGRDAQPVAAGPLPRPSPAPLSRQLSPAELRVAVATGRIGLESLLSRRDATTIGADAAALLRVLPGHAPEEITETLRKAQIDGGATIGDLTLRQRHLLLAALSDATPSR
ncbi:hypothetical protein ACWEPL_61630 [Nonomuraea sp. NPDC004186]